MWNRTAILAAAAVFLLLVHFHVRQIYGGSILFDDAWIASAAKNLAVGAGYSSSYPEVVPFHPHITTGPFVVLVAAALVKVFGNEYWVPNLAIAVCVLLVFAVFGWLVWRRFGTLVLSVMLVPVALRLTFPPAGESGLLGEMPAAGMVAIGAMLIAPGNRSPVFRLLGAGVAVGLAIQTKLIAVLVLPAFAGALLFLHRRPTDGRAVPGAGSRWKLAGGFSAGLLIPFFLWNLLILYVAGSWSAWLEANRYFFAEVATFSGLDVVAGGANLVDQVGTTFARNRSALVEHAGGGVWALLFGCAVVAALTGLFRSRLPPALLARDLAPAAVLGAAASVHVAWWLLLSPNDWARYLFPGILYAVIAVALAVAVCIHRTPRTALVAIALLLVSWVPQLRANWNFGHDGRLPALLAARDALAALIDGDDVVLMGCGYWVTWDLEYLLPTVGNFRDCLELDPQDIGDRRLLLVRNEYFNWEKAVPIEALREACDRSVLFARAPFVISECPGLWPLTFPWAGSEPQPLRQDHPFAVVLAPGGVPATLSHAASALSLRATGTERTIVVGFGLLDAAWQDGKTDGVEFRISIVDSSGTTLLWHRILDPLSRVEDRGVQTATIWVPATFEGGTVLAETLPGPAGDARWDWSYWSAIDLR